MGESLKINFAKAPLFRARERVHAVEITADMYAGDEGLSPTGHAPFGVAGDWMISADGKQISIMTKAEFAARYEADRAPRRVEPDGAGA